MMPEAGSSLYATARPTVETFGRGHPARPHPPRESCRGSAKKSTGHDKQHE